MRVIGIPRLMTENGIQFGAASNQRSICIFFLPLPRRLVCMRPNSKERKIFHNIRIDWDGIYPDGGAVINIFILPPPHHDPRGSPKQLKHDPRGKRNTGKEEIRGVTLGSPFLIGNEGSITVTFGRFFEYFPGTFLCFFACRVNTMEMGRELTFAFTDGSNYIHQIRRSCHFFFNIFAVIFQLLNMAFIFLLLLVVVLCFLLFVFCDNFHPLFRFLPFTFLFLMLKLGRLNFSFTLAFLFLLLTFGHPVSSFLFLFLTPGFPFVSCTLELLFVRSYAVTLSIIALFLLFALLCSDALLALCSVTLTSLTFGEVVV
mmetsp:Transcript_23743/g.42468  ORF Transcript_23743/g.42468 Transcript_23743/m.42468 type:complete len:315 (-) Transcript_23743:100-1044(-)